MKKAWITFGFFSLILFNVSAQSITYDSLKALYERETMYQVGSRFMKNGKALRPGFLGNKIKNEFKISPEGQQQFMLYRKKTGTGLILLGLGYTAMVSSIFIAYNNPELYWPVFGGGMTMLIGSSILTVNGTRHFQKAVWYRNRDVLLNGAR